MPYLRDTGPLQVRLWSPHTLVAGAGEDALSRVLSTLETDGGVLAPRRMTAPYSAPYSAETVHRTLESFAEEGGGAVHLHGDEMAVTWQIATTGVESKARSWLTADIPYDSLIAPGAVTNGAGALVELIGRLAVDFSADYGVADSAAALVISGDRRVWDPFAEPELVDSMWLYLLGSDVAEWLGRTRVRTAPAVVVCELNNGAMVVQATAMPEPGGGLNGAAVLQHLRPDHVPTGEYGAADNVDEAAILTQVSDSAEAFRALLYGDVDDILDGGPEMFNAIDDYFVAANYRRRVSWHELDPDLVLAVGAYLGEMLVEHLNGYWLFRERVGDSAVVVGAYAWLPFLRARRFLAGRDGPSANRLTSFYRAAADDRI